MSLPTVCFKHTGVVWCSLVGTLLGPASLRGEARGVRGASLLLMHRLVFLVHVVVFAGSVFRLFRRHFVVRRQRLHRTCFIRRSIIFLSPLKEGRFLDKGSHVFVGMDVWWRSVWLESHDREHNFCLTTMSTALTTSCIIFYLC